MKNEDSRRRFSRALKLAAVQRMAMGANVSKLSRELGVSRKGLYQWQKQFRAGGPSALRGAGRPPRGAAIQQPSAGISGPEPSGWSDDLSKALARIAELERLVGQQTVDLHFFGKPCSTSGENAERAARLAGRRLRGH